MRADSPRFAVVAARGTNDHAALYLKYLLEVRLGVPTALASPSAMTLYGARPRLEGALWLAVSQSGGSPDLIESTRVAATKTYTSELLACWLLVEAIRGGDANWRAPFGTSQ